MIAGEFTVNASQNALDLGELLNGLDLQDSDDRQIAQRAALKTYGRGLCSIGAVPDSSHEYLQTIERQVLLEARAMLHDTKLRVFEDDPLQSWRRLPENDEEAANLKLEAGALAGRARGVWQRRTRVCRPRSARERARAALKRGARLLQPQFHWRRRVGARVHGTDPHAATRESAAARGGGAVAARCGRRVAPPTGGAWKSRGAPASEPAALSRPARPPTPTEGESIRLAWKVKSAIPPERRGAATLRSRHPRSHRRSDAMWPSLSRSAVAVPLCGHCRRAAAGRHACCPVAPPPPLRPAAARPLALLMLR